MQLPVPIGEVIARSQSSFAIVERRPAMSVYIQELIKLNKSEEESKQESDF